MDVWWRRVHNFIIFDMLSYSFALIRCKPKSLNSKFCISYCAHLSIILGLASIKIWVNLQLIPSGWFVWFLISTFHIWFESWRFTPSKMIFNCYSLGFLIEICVVSLGCKSIIAIKVYIFIKAIMHGHESWVFIFPIVYYWFLVFDIAVNLYFRIMHHFGNEGSYSLSIILTQLIVFFYKLRSIKRWIL